MALSKESKKPSTLKVIEHEPRAVHGEIPCRILRAFEYSRDGFTSQFAGAGELVNVPEHLVEGLEAEGYVKRQLV